VRHFCPSMESRSGNVDAFLLNAGAKSLGVGAICPDTRAGKGNAEVLSSDAGAKTLDDGVPRPAQEAMGTADAVPRTDCAAESIGRGRQSASAITFSLRYARPVFRGEWMTMQRWLIAAAITCVAATGCSEAPQGTTTQTARRPQQAGEVTNPLVTASHLAAFDAAAVTATSVPCARTSKRCRRT
jgi:hypothetical protein